MSLKMMGKKKGMLQLFDDKGNVVACTVIEVEPNVVTQIKTQEQDGYNAVQLGFGKMKKSRANKPQRGHFDKNKIEYRRHLVESRVDIDSYSVGQEIDVGIFADVAYLDVTGTTKGKGYQGVVKLYGFRGGPASHGSHFHRHGGSTGMRSTPGICFKGSKLPGRMGGKACTTQNVQVVRVDSEKNIILVKGSIPGSVGDLVYIRQSVKKK